MVSGIVKLGIKNNITAPPRTRRTRREGERGRGGEAQTEIFWFSSSSLPLSFFRFVRFVRFVVRRFIFFSILSAPLVALAQSAEPSRRFWPPSFRPSAATSKAKPQPAKYRRTTPALPKTDRAAATGDAVLGITIWRLRPAIRTDEARLLLTKSGMKSAFTPERVEASTTFTEGQMVRLSIEVPRTGYLYIIDREQYADNTMSEPYLIFPLNPNGSAHKVTAGRVIELPPQNDDQAAFELHTFRPAGKPPQSAELLTFLITPEPLTGLPRATGDDQPLKLAPALVADWEHKWSAQVEQLELENGAGRAYTHAEQRAGLNVKHRLTQADPLPQTVFRVEAKPGSPFMVKLPLKIGQ